MMMYLDNDGNPVKVTESYLRKMIQAQYGLSVKIFRLDHLETYNDQNVIRHCCTGAGIIMQTVLIQQLNDTLIYYYYCNKCNTYIYYFEE